MVANRYTRDVQKSQNSTFAAQELGVGCNELVPMKAEWSSIERREAYRAAKLALDQQIEARERACFENL